VDSDIFEVSSGIRYGGAARSLQAGMGGGRVEEDISLTWEEIKRKSTENAKSHILRLLDSKRKGRRRKLQIKKERQGGSETDHLAKRKQRGPKVSRSSGP